jgi:hypothetical protein
VVVGATFLPGVRQQIKCFRKHPLEFAAHFFGQFKFWPERPSRVTGGGFTAFQLLISRLRGRGQNCFVSPENLSWGVPNPSPVPLYAPVGLTQNRTRELALKTSSPSTLPVGSHLLPVKTFPPQSTRRKCGAIPDHARREKSIACPPDIARQ